jgi:hypothetical protein
METATIAAMLGICLSILSLLKPILTLRSSIDLMSYRLDKLEAVVQEHFQ